MLEVVAQTHRLAQLAVIFLRRIQHRAVIAGNGDAVEFQPAHRGRNQMRDRRGHRGVDGGAGRGGQHHRGALRFRGTQRKRRRAAHREHHPGTVDAVDVHDGAFELALQRALIVHLLIEVALPHGRAIEQGEIFRAAGKAGARLQQRARLVCVARADRDRIGTEGELDVVAAQAQRQRGAIGRIQIGYQHHRCAGIDDVERRAEQGRDPDGSRNQVEELTVAGAKIINQLERLIEIFLQLLHRSAPQTDRFMISW